jgi:hypothetical protein
MRIPYPLPAAVLLFSGSALAQSFPLTTCTNQPGSSSPSLQYTISPNFVWFPGSVTPDDILDLLRRSKSKLFDTTTAAGAAGPAGGVIRTQIPNFFNSKCSMNLAIRISQTTAPATTMRLLNETLGGTDLLCRLATHKTGRIFTEKPHTMLSMHLKAVVLQPSPVSGPKMFPRQADDAREAPPSLNGETPLADDFESPQRLPNDAPPSSQGRWSWNRRPQRGSTERVAGAAAAVPAGFEYTITCPRSAGPPLTGAAAAAGLEGLQDLAIVRDCDWCKKAAGELQGLCVVQTVARARAEGDGGAGEGMWGFGGVTCEGCK